jgi:hypothetical protein
VASEHIFRPGLASTLLKWAISPVIRMKGMTDASAAMGILRALRGGASVCLFAEGDRSWNGLTGRIHPTTARLIKSSGVGVITYRLTGGYLTSPRWGVYTRRGRTRGETVSEYSPETVAGMTPDELRDALERDIFVDAYSDQRGAPVRYIGRANAERLETAVYLCPSCGGTDTLRSDGDRFFCSCGLSLVCNDYGFFEGESLPFDTVTQWDEWQDAKLRERAAAGGPGGAIYLDEGQTLDIVEGDHRRRETFAGRLSLTRDALRLGDFTARLHEISGMSMTGRETIVFTVHAQHYEISSKGGANLRKYLTMFQILREMR